MAGTDSLAASFRAPHPYIHVHLKRRHLVKQIGKLATLDLLPQAKGFMLRTCTLWSDRIQLFEKKTSFMKRETCQLIKSQLNLPLVSSMCSVCPFHPVRNSWPWLSANICLAVSVCVCVCVCMCVCVCVCVCVRGGDKHLERFIRSLFMHDFRCHFLMVDPWCAGIEMLCQVSLKRHNLCRKMIECWFYQVYKYPDRIRGNFFKHFRKLSKSFYKKLTFWKSFKMTLRWAIGILCTDPIDIFIILLLPVATNRTYMDLYDRCICTSIVLDVTSGHVRGSKTYSLYFQQTFCLSELK